jgi:c-di-GMP phosphodiesterase
VDLYIARQPIYDDRGGVVAYELLYRRGAQSRGADGDSAWEMSLEVIVKTFLEIGLERLTLGKLAFLNFDRGMLLGGYYDLLDPRMVVIELLESIEADAEVVAACERLTGLGYRLALDDYVADAAHEPLVRFAEIIKLDVMNVPPGRIAEQAAPLRERGLRLLAERVETEEVHAHCRSLGFELFQGYHFSRPEVVERKGMAAEQTAILRLMNLLRDERVPDQEVEEAFRRDPSLSFKLLRMVNAAAQGGRGIESILHAIRLLGRVVLERWLALLLVSSLATRGGADAERVRAAVQRARLCELIGSTHGRGVAGQLFLTGLFSTMDSLLHLPMAEVVCQVHLTPAVRDALLQREGPLAPVLDMVEAYEEGNWDGVTGLAPAAGVAAPTLPELYLDSLEWAQETLALAG